MKIKPLALAYAVAPLGAVAFFVVLTVPGFGAELGSVVAWALVAGLAYAVGALLLPVYFVLEHFGRRGWQFYVPVAFLARLAVGPALESPASLGGWRLALLCAVAGGLCGVVFSYVLASRGGRD